MGGLRDFIMDQNCDEVANTIRKVKEELDFDGAAINQLHLAIYLFQESVNEVLRLHSIKPHWMFALDNLVRTAVQAAITVLSPELGANLAGQETRSKSGDVADGEASPSDVSTVNSVKSSKTVDSMYQIRFRQNYREQLGILKTENMRYIIKIIIKYSFYDFINFRLMQELLDSQRQYQTLLRQVLNENRQQFEALHQILDTRRVTCPKCNYSAQISANSTGYGSVSTPTSDMNLHENAEGKILLSPQINISNPGLDLRLSEWLQGLGIDPNSIDRILAEEYTLEDILYHITRDDLRRLQLRLY